MGRTRTQGLSEPPLNGANLRELAAEMAARKIGEARAMSSQFADQWFGEDEEPVTEEKR